MSPKELLYIEDALGHDKQIKTLCTETAEMVKDDDLKNLIQQIGARHANTFSDMYALLG